MIFKIGPFSCVIMDNIFMYDVFTQDCVIMEQRFDHRWDDVYCDYTTVQVRTPLTQLDKY